MEIRSDVGTSLILIRSQLLDVQKNNFRNLTGFQNLSGLVCEIIYLKNYRAKEREQTPKLKLWKTESKIYFGIFYYSAMTDKRKVSPPL
ncbi:hypothetical protein BGP_1410 [Beggiatoa sp. PS]|nr:hypothetical protein BGP_1410 [Beggiatoa sp. PS]